MSSRTGNGDTWVLVGDRTADSGPGSRLPAAGYWPAVSGARGQHQPGRRPAPGSESAGWAIFSYLIGGMAVYGGIGWLISRWAGHMAAFVAGGMIVGLALALVMVIFRYGRA